MNRFTSALDALSVIDKGTNFERFLWEDIHDLNESIYDIYNAFNESIIDSLDTVEVFSARNLFLSLLSNMSDEDLMECFGI